MGKIQTEGADAQHLRADEAAQLWWNRARQIVVGSSPGRQDEGNQRVTKGLPKDGLPTDEMGIYEREVSPGVCLPPKQQRRLGGLRQRLATAASFRQRARA